MFCKECGNQIARNAAVCVRCGVATGNVSMSYALGSKSRLAFILLGIFLGGLGIHNFYAGYYGRGIAQLLLSLSGICLFIPWLLVCIWVLIEICVVTQDASGNRLA